MSDRNIVHATFILERTYPAPVPRVFHAWADPGVKALWFAGGPNGYEMDFRPDGIEQPGIGVDIRRDDHNLIDPLHVHVAQAWLRLIGAGKIDIDDLILGQRCLRVQVAHVQRALDVVLHARPGI